MKQPALVNTKQELKYNTHSFADQIPILATQNSAERDAIANGCSHAVEWVGFENDDGGWDTAFCKFAGYNGLTFTSYDKLRQTNLTGTDTKRRVEKLGGTYYGVGADAGIPSNHPAVDAVKAVCAMFGKSPKRTAKVRVFTRDERSAAMNILAAAIRAADLKPAELEALFAEVRAAA